MQNKRDIQFAHELEMRDRLEEWLTAAKAMPCNDHHHVWFAGAISALRGFVVYRTAHLSEAVLLDIAKEVDHVLSSRDAADKIVAARTIA